MRCWTRFCLGTRTRVWPRRCWSRPGFVLVAGEVTTSTWVDLEALVRGLVKEVGYNSSELGFDGSTCGVLNAIGKQSPDIRRGVNAG